MKSIKANFIYQVSYEILAIILPLVTSPYIARILGAENIGISSYTLTIANYFTLFCALGIKNYGNREISIVRDDKELLDRTFSEILEVHIIVSFIVFMIYLIFCFLYDNNLRLYLLIQGIHVLAALIDISWLFFGLEEFKRTVTRNTIIKIVSVICIFIFVKTDSDLWKYILIVALGVFFGQAYLWLYVNKLVKIVRVDIRSAIRHLRPLLVLFIPTLAISVYNYMDKIMLGLMSTNTQLGYYENSEKIIFAASAVLYSLGTVMMPRMSNLVANGKIELEKKYIELSTQIIMMLSCALCFGLIGISYVFAPVFWGDEFNKCSLLLALLAFVLPIKGTANVVRTQYLIPNKRDKEYIVSVCLGAIVNLIVNITLIPKLNAIGAVIGTIAAELAVFSVQFIWTQKEIPLTKYLRKSIVYVPIGLFMCISVNLIGYKLGKSVLTLALQIISGILIYATLTLSYIKIKRPEMIQSILKKYR